MGCKQSKADPTLYVLVTGKDFVVLVVYVDNIVLLVNVLLAVSRFIIYFKKHFEIRILEKIGKILGMTVEDRRSEVWFQNKPFIESLLKVFGMAECISVATPLIAVLNLN